MQLVSTISSALPPSLPGIAGGAFTAYQLLATAASYKAETNAESRTQYSKFATNANADGTEVAAAPAATWSSRVGMLVIYTPALVASLALLVLGSVPEGSPAAALSIPPPSPAAVLCALHFAKRVGEVLVVHKYSGRVDRNVPSFIGFYYAIIAVLIGLVSDPNPSEVARKVGTALFGVGLAGNLYHHQLLANLRGTSSSGSETKKYVAPKGGLFYFVAAPHYLFELIGWLGMAIVSNHLNVYLVFASMCSYLSGRSVGQNEFNRKKFSNDEWPENRKNLIPFIF